MYQQAVDKSSHDLIVGIADRSAKQPGVTDVALIKSLEVCLSLSMKDFHERFPGCLYAPKYVVCFRQENEQKGVNYMHASFVSARSNTARKNKFLLKRKTPPGLKINDPSMSLGKCHPKTTRGSAITPMVQTKQNNPINRFYRKMTVARLKNRVALSLGNEFGRSQKVLHTGSTTFNGSDASRTGRV
jgi:hypothetical protein